MRVWNGEQLGAFLAATADDPLAMLIAHTGLRRGEAVALRWTEVDLAAGSLTVSRQHVDVGYRVIEGEPKTRTSTCSCAAPPYRGSASTTCATPTPPSAWPPGSPPKSWPTGSGTPR